jgi:hypothetical protein
VVAHGYSLAEFRERVDGDPRGGFIDGMVMYGKHSEYDR